MSNSYRFMPNSASAVAADRLTQLQDAVDLQAENFCNSIGILPTYAQRSTFPEFDATNDNPNQSNNPNEQTKSTDRSRVNHNLSDESSNTAKASQTTNRQCRASVDNCQFFARLIARTAKDIDTLIESLPATCETDFGSSDLFTASIRQLELENRQCVQELERVIERGEAMLAKLQEALDDIASIQLKAQDLTNLSFDNKK